MSQRLIADFSRVFQPRQCRFSDSNGDSILILCCLERLGRTTDQPVLKPSLSKLTHNPNHHAPSHESLAEQNHCNHRRFKRSWPRDGHAFRCCRRPSGHHCSRPTTLDRRLPRQPKPPPGRRRHPANPVSYTHLTLPTILLV